MEDSTSKLLVATIQELSKSKTIDEIMKVVRTSSRKLTGSDGTTFVLRDGNLCFYADEDAIEPLWKGQRFPMETCVSGWAMLNKRSTVIPDIYKDSRIPVDAYRPTFVKSMVMVPIRTEDPIGAIGNYWATEYTPTEAQVAAIQALADTTAVAIENVKLYASLQKQVAELAAANESKDALLMTVSHELRTPLNAIQGWAQLLLSSTLDDQQIQQAYHTIERNAQGQSRIIDDLLDSSRIVLGRLEIKRDHVNLSTVANHVIQSLRPTTNLKHIDIITHHQIEKPVVIGDMDRMKQIVRNLLSNAIKFTPEGSSIEITIDKSGPNVCLKIKDHGRGIAPEIIPQLFTPFRQVDTTTTRKFSGLGLGLSIVKHLTEAQNGNVILKSDGIGKGTTAIVSFPLASPVSIGTSDSTSTSAAVKPRLLDGYRVLVIDDDPDARDVAALALSGVGATVETADGASPGRKMLTTFNPDVIICDISMPEEDGFTFIKKIRDGIIPEFTKVPAVALTAFNDESHQQQAKAAGFDGFIGKPFRIPQLIEAIKDFVL